MAVDPAVRKIRIRTRNTFFFFSALMKGRQKQQIQQFIIYVRRLMCTTAKTL